MSLSAGMIDADYHSNGLVNKTITSATFRVCIFIYLCSVCILLCNQSMSKMLDDSLMPHMTTFKIKNAEENTNTSHYSLVSYQE